MVCSRNPARAPETVRTLHLLHTTDYRQLVHDQRIELVSVCTPDHLHTEPVLAALNAGKHVLCEKPLATTLDDCRRILEASQRAGTKFLTGQILRFAPLFRSLKGIYERGSLGRIVFAESDYLHDIRFLLGGWRSDPASHWDLTLAGGCHPVDLLRWIVGEIEQVHARANKFCLINEPVPADNILLSLAFANGAIRKVQLTCGCPRPYALNLSLYGTRGTLVNNRLFTEDIDSLEDFIQLPLPQKSEFPYYGEEIADIVRAIRHNTQTAVSAADGARSVAVCLAGVQSARIGQPITVEQF
mgnify:CR=1 FL=1